ncbi:hypothetical protein AAFF_G00328310 [Aldrovandia affinis]|uniref:Uncharacterized protein n=1 Tax=Aldrovandia affinis TaxID=143900 RepID=A0AAD7X1Q8_9TELE|nr:hypothetical protein AAFF_G00328310 [Aldrovandia affinis]
MEGRGGSAEGDGQTSTPGGRGHGADRAGRPRMERSTCPVVQGKQEGEEGPCCFEVTRIEQEELRVKSVAQGQQGRWTTWEGVASRAINWADFWKLPQARLSFLIRANLHQWLGTEQSCDLKWTINASLQHVVLSGCKTALTQGRLTWRHDQVLRKLAEVLEKCRQEGQGLAQEGDALPCIVLHGHHRRCDSPKA